MPFSSLGDHMAARPRSRVCVVKVSGSGVILKGSGSRSPDSKFARECRPCAHKFATVCSAYNIPEFPTVRGLYPQMASMACSSLFRKILNAPFGSLKTPRRDPKLTSRTSPVDKFLNIPSHALKYFEKPTASKSWALNPSPENLNIED